MEIDYLIVGGGIQGLTLLDELVAAGAGRVLLVSRDALGVGESLHSHGYMHLGYTLPSADRRLATELAECGAAWWRRIQRMGSAYARQLPTYYGVSGEDVAARLDLWDRLDLPYEPLVEPPEPLRGGAASGPEVRHFRIRDRTVSMRELLADLAGPHRGRIARGTLTGIDLDAAGKRIVGCHLALGDAAAETLRVRPRALLLAAGRSAQPLLRLARTPDGGRPLEEVHRGFHRIRYVPMLLVRGRGLPALTTVLQSSALSIASHATAGDESTWIVTHMRDHETDRGDLDEERESAPGPALRASLELLRELCPEVRARMDRDLRFGFYHGGKIDHPDGGNRRYVDDRGVENLRVLWPGLWSLALANARQVVDELLESVRHAPGARTEDAASPPLDAARLRGAPLGEELRETDAVTWRSHAELDAWT